MCELTLAKMEKHGLVLVCLLAMFWCIFGFSGDLQVGDYSSNELYLERLVLEDGANQTIVHGRPVWYVDEDGAKRRIGLDFESDVDAGYVRHGNATNTLKSWVRGDGHIKTMCIDGEVEYWLVGEKRGRRGLPSWVLEHIPAVAVTACTSAANTAVTRRGNVDIETVVLPGGLKDTVTVHAPGSQTDLSAPYSVIFGYVSDLTPEKVDGAIHWVGDVGVVLRWQAPTAWDSMGASFDVGYELVGGEVILSALGGVEGLVWPLYFDPTTITGQSDAQANAVTLEDRYSGGSSDDGYTNSYVLFALPSLGADSPIAAVIRVQSTGGVTNDVLFDVFADSVGTGWSDSSTYTVLEALSFNAATATDQEAPSASSTQYDYDVYGTSSSGLLKAYNDVATDLTVKFHWTNYTAGTPSIDDAELNFRVGDWGDTSRRVRFELRSNATYYPRLVITHLPPPGGGAVIDYYRKLQMP